MRRLMLSLAMLIAAAPHIVMAEATVAEHPSAALFDDTATAAVDVDTALAQAAANGRRVVVVMGANWCHDSKGLAGWFETPRFRAMLRQKYEVVYVDVGTPQTGLGRNLDIAKRFGIDKVKSTPLVLVLSSSGERLNSKQDAARWRNAASRNEDAIFDYFDDFISAKK